MPIEKENMREDSESKDYRKANRSKMLYQILLEEYKGLGIFTKDDVEHIFERRTEFSGLDWSKSEIGADRRARILADIRKKLAEVAAREFNISYGDLYRESQNLQKEYGNVDGKNMDEGKDVISKRLKEVKQREVLSSLSALCFSGGGIRSATLGLGVLQALAKQGLLEKFTYLSSVSGGGYIMSWLSAWIDREGSVEKVQASLNGDPKYQSLFHINDFDCNFDKRFSTINIVLLKKRLQKRKIVKLIGKNNIDCFFDNCRLFNLGEKEGSLREDLKNQKAREVYKELCRCLNSIIRDQDGETDALRDEARLGNIMDSVSRSNQKRIFLEARFSKFLTNSVRFSTVDFAMNFDSSDEEEVRETKAKTELLKGILKENIGLYGAEVYESFAELVDDKDNEKQKITEKGAVWLLCENLNKIVDDQKAETATLVKQLEGVTDSFLRVRRKYQKLKKPISRVLKKKRPRIVTGVEPPVEPPEVTHLRSFSNYMSPKPGLFSSDTWTLISVYLRNLLLNWLVFVPILASVLLIPVWIHSLFSLGYKNPVSPSFLDDQFLLLLLVGAVGVYGVRSILAMRPTFSEFSWIDQRYTVDDIDRVQSTKDVLIKGFLPLISLAILSSFYWFWAMRSGVNNYFRDATPTSVQNFLPDVILNIVPFLLFGVILFLGGFLAAHVGFYRFLRKEKSNDESDKQKLRKQRFRKELWISIVCGAVGGAILYFGTIVINALHDNLEIQSSKDKLLPFDGVAFYASVSVPLFLIVFGVSAILFIGMASKITDDMDREWMARFGGWVFMFAIGWLAVFAIVFSGPHILSWTMNGEYGTSFIASLGGISGLITLVLGFSKKSNGSGNGAAKSWSSKIIGLAPQILAPVFIIFLLILVVLGTNYLIYVVGMPTSLTGSQMSYPNDFSDGLSNLIIYSAWILLFFLFGLLMGRRININKFSLHATYRERLIRAYLGASRSKERLKTANSFTDLDEEDNLQMKDLYQKPFHVVNMALNLVKTDKLRWQDRKAESFTATSLHCGSSMMGFGSGHFRTSERYGFNEQNNRAITLGTAAAISGAAASPNMGYYTQSIAVSFLMTLFNIRLGWWMGNPGTKGKKTYDRSSPNRSPALLFIEASGGTTDANSNIQLSDGGHFENLGIYEMVLRRCRFIVAVDSTADPDFYFSDLGNAIHKIRVDMGIPIEFDEKPVKGRYCTTAAIKYSVVDGTDDECDGKLIYIKPTLDGKEPIDIKHYHSKHSSFPHETTGDQWFSESQFESYRALGFHMMDSICGKGKEEIGDFFDVKQNARKYMKEIDKEMKKKKAV